MKWAIEPVMYSRNPIERTKTYIGLIEMVKEDMEAGLVKDWGVCSGEMRGFAITSDLSDAQVHSWLLKYFPYINFEVNPVLTIDQQLESLAEYK